MDTTQDIARIVKLTRHAGIAGQFAITARVEYPGFPLQIVTFIGSTYGGPVVMRCESGRETFVTDPERFGEFGEAWVREFFARS
jgi:hypothetical protein